MYREPHKDDSSVRLACTSYETRKTVTSSNQIVHQSESVAHLVSRTHSFSEPGIVYCHHAFSPSLVNSLPVTGGSKGEQWIVCLPIPEFQTMKQNCQSGFKLFGSVLWSACRYDKLAGACRACITPRHSRRTKPCLGSSTTQAIACAVQVV